MGESNKKDVNAEQREDLISDRLSEATSDKVVSDLPTESETSADADSDLSPDGALDQRDEVKDAGPM
ncbi:MAG TPA: hypothetical protein VIW64_08995 [Pyrinomonadaceae bacterium]|jgi:hypothetical protein